METKTVLVTLAYGVERQDEEWKNHDREIVSHNGTLQTHTARTIYHAVINPADLPASRAFGSYELSSPVCYASRGLALMVFPEGSTLRTVRASLCDTRGDAPDPDRGCGASSPVVSG